MWSCLLAFFVCGCASPRIAKHDGVSSPSESQRAHVLTTVAAFKHLGFQVVAARLRLGVDTALAWRQLDTLLTRPTGDMFWMYPAVGFYFNTKSQLSQRWIDRFRRTWATYTPYRGDTENHFLMYYASLLLMSQEWPGLPGTAWFNGKTSRENYDEAREYLEHWIDETVRRGSTEWDSPRYAYYYITPLILLRDFTSDESLRQRCEMMLELTLADYAADYLNGSYCGAHSRDGDGAVIDPRKGEVSSYAQFYFTDTSTFVLPDLAYAAMSSWTCPTIIRDIAHDRAKPFVHTERKRSRARIRYEAERFSTVIRYNYMTPDYCLGSIQGGVVQPIQQHTWDVTFASSRPNNTIFALHPTHSARELGTFFPEEPDAMVEGVARAKASYTNANKWVGGSPYEFVAQDSNVLVAVYDIPAAESIRHVDVLLPASLDTLVRFEDGWLFARMEDALVAMRIYADSVTESRETFGTRLRAWPGGASRLFDNAASTALAIVTVCASQRSVSWSDFIATMRGASSVRRSKPVAQVMAGSSVRIDNGLGGAREFTWRGAERGLVATTRVVANTFQGPHIQSGTAGPNGDEMIIMLTVGNQHRILDFARNPR